MIFEQKRRWREYKKRVKALPPSHRAGCEALERYLLHAGGVAQADVLVRMADDLASLFEQAAADGTPVRDVIGDDPVEFAETFLANYSDGQWVTRERARLVRSIADAEALT